MSKRCVRLGTLVAVACGVWLGAEQSAHASGYLVARFGSDHGTPAMANNYSIYYNPAAIAGMKGTQITGDISGLLRFVSYTRQATALSPSDPSLLNDPSYVKSNTGNNKLLNVLAIPYFGISSDFGSKYFRLGYALYVPFGGLATWKRPDEVSGVPGSSDGPQRWHNISGQILTVYNTLAGSAKIGDTGIAIGASFSPIIHNVSTVRARNLDGSDDTAGGGSIKEGRSVVNAFGVNFGAAFGVYYANPDSTVRMGLSYTSQPGFGDTKINGTLKQVLGNEQPGGEQKITFSNAYPDIVRLGGAIGLSKRVEVRADFEYVRWSTFTKQCVAQRGAPCTLDGNGSDPSGKNVILNIPREWKDAVGWRIGPGFMVTDNLELFTSFGITTPAVPKKTIDASTVDALRFYMTGGARFNVSKKTAIGVSYNHIYFTDVNTNGESGQYRYRKPDGSYNQSTSPSADGTFKSQVAMLNANINYTF